MRILRVPLGRLRPWRDNPRDIDRAGLEALVAQIRELGLYKPLLATQEGKEFMILGGNMRLQAFAELGWGPETIIEISVVLAPDDETKLRYALSDNDSAGRTDPELLERLIQRAGINRINLHDFRIHLQAPQPIDLASFPSAKPVGPGTSGAAASDDTLPSKSDVHETSREGEEGPSASPSRNIEGEDVEALAARIREEKEYRNEGPDPDAIVTAISAVVRTLARENPEALKRAFMLITPLGHGRSFILLADPEVDDAAAEIRRLAQAGERSPLEAFLAEARPLEIPEETPDAGSPS